MLDEVSKLLQIANARNVRRYAYAVPLSLLFHTMGAVIIFTIITKQGRVIPLELYVTILTTNLTNFIQVALPAAYIVLLWICSFLFENYNKLIQEQLAQPVVDILSLRKLHANLCGAISTVMGAFGVQVIT